MQIPNLRTYPWLIIFIWCKWISQQVIWWRRKSQGHTNQLWWSFGMREATKLSKILLGILTIFMPLSRPEQDTGNNISLIMTRNSQLVWMKTSVMNQCILLIRKIYTMRQQYCQNLVVRYVRHLCEMFIEMAMEEIVTKSGIH